MSATRSCRQRPPMAIRCSSRLQRGAEHERRSDRAHSDAGLRKSRSNGSGRRTRGFGAEHGRVPGFHADVNRAGQQVGPDSQRDFEHRQCGSVRVVFLAAIALETDQPSETDPDSADDLRGAETVQSRIEQDGTRPVTRDIGTIPTCAANRSGALGPQHPSESQAERTERKEFVAGPDRDCWRRRTTRVAAKIREGPDGSDRCVDFQPELLVCPARCSDADENKEQAQAHAGRTRPSAGRPRPRRSRSRGCYLAIKRRLPIPPSLPNARGSRTPALRRG